MSASGRRARLGTRAPVGLAGLAGLALLGGCGAADGGDRELHGTLRRAIRPTDGAGWLGNAYEKDAVVKFSDPPGEHFRVYYALTGMSAVDPTDLDPADGVPDFVTRVGAAAEATYQSTVVARGFRPPLDDSKYHDRPDFGGDGRFDIYLRFAGPGSDGYRVVEACTDGSDGGAPDRCAGYFVMNPTFKGSQYKTELDGIQVLTSHELFHAIQDAYNRGQWRTFSEGTAVWNELQVFPRTPEHDGTFRDYLGFARALFNEPERPLDLSMGTGPGGAYAYATAVWFEYLSERFGPQLIRELWEGSEAARTGEPPQFMDVTAALLRSRYQTELEAAFVEFTRWNLLTAERAPDAPAEPPGPAGYQRAAEYPPVRLEPAITQLGQRQKAEVSGLSARYFELAVPLAAPQRLRLHLDDPAAPPAVGTLYVVPAGGKKPGPAVVIPGPGPGQGPGSGPGSGLDVEVQPGQRLLVVVSGATRGARSREVAVYLDTDVGPPGGPAPDPMTPPAELGGCAVRGAGRPVAAGWLWTLLAAGLLGLRRRVRG